MSHNQRVTLLLPNLNLEHLPDVGAQAALPRAQHAASAPGGSFSQPATTLEDKKWDDDRMVQFTERVFFCHGSAVSEDERQLFFGKSWRR